MINVKWKKVSVIIPTLDRSEVLIDTLNNLLRQDYPDFEIIVVDQTENQKKAVLDFISRNANIKYLKLQQKSLPNARNAGVEKSTGEIVLFVDDDVEIRDKQFISHHANNYFEHKIGLVGGRVIYDWLENKRFPLVGRFLIFGLIEITNFNANSRAKIDHAPGGNFSCLKTVYQQVGGFSMLYKGSAHMEETDFCFRVRRAGYKLFFEPKAVLKHLQFSSGGCRVLDIYDLRYWLVHNYIFFYLRNFSKILFPLAFVREYFWCVFSSLKRMDIKMYQTMTKAIFDGVKYFRTIKKEQI